MSIASREVGPASNTSSTGSTTITATLSRQGSQIDAYTQPIPTLKISFSIIDTQIINLSSGANTITPPVTTVTGFVIVMPTGNTQTCTLKGVSGDTGLSMNLIGWTIHCFNTASVPATFVLTTGGTINAVTIYWF